MLSRKITVCKDCVPPERHIGCHSDCEKYIKELDEYEELRKEIARNKALDRLHRDYTMQSAMKTSKKWKKK